MTRIFSSINVKEVALAIELQTKELLASQVTWDLALMSILIPLEMHLKGPRGTARSIMDLFFKMIVEIKEEDASNTEKMI